MSLAFLTKAGFGSHVPSRAPDTASRDWKPLFIRPIAEAKAAPLIATAACTIRSRLMRDDEIGGQA